MSTSLPVANDAGIVRITVGDNSAIRVCGRMVTPPSEQVAFRCCYCAEIRVKHRHWRCLGRVNVTCDKFDNRLYVLKTGYQFSGYCFSNPYSQSYFCLGVYSHLLARSIGMKECQLLLWNCQEENMTLLFCKRSDL